MKKIKSGEFIKIAAAVLLSTAFFSAGFIALNNLVFAAATNGTESIPPAETAVYIPSTAVIMPDDYPIPELTVSNQHKLPPADADVLSAEEAAQIGAFYIREVFEKSIDGTDVLMEYLDYSNHTRPYWRGFVYERNETETNNPVFDFTVCAISGERVGVVQIDAAELENQENADAAKSVSFDGYLDLVRSVISPSQQEVEQLIPLAREFAEKHFTFTDVESVEFVEATPLTLAFNENGKVVVSAVRLAFIAIDETGREATVWIRRGQEKPYFITTIHNDMIPGYGVADNADNMLPTPEPDGQ